MANEAKAIAEGRGLPRPVRRFVAVSAGLTALCVGVEAICRFGLRLGYPYDWPLLPEPGHFPDFLLHRARFGFFHSAEFYSFSGPAYLYPAPMAVVHWLLLQMPTAAFLTLLTAAILGAGCWFGRVLVRQGMPLKAVGLLLGTTAVCSYPFWFEFEQANLEWAICALVMAGIWCFLRGRGYGAAVCFGLAGSMKFYPIVFAGLLLARRQYRATAVALATAAVSMAASLWLVCPDVRVSWRGMQQGLAAFRVWYMLGYEQVGFDHSVFAGVKALWLMASGKPLPPQSLALLLGIYMPGIAFAGIVLYFDRIRKLPVVNQVLCLTIATILLPPVSYDYTLLHLYAPWAMLVLVAMDGRERAVPGLTAAFVCLAVAMTPLSEAIVHGQGYGGQGKAVALVALFGISLRFRFGSRFDVGWMG